MCVCVCACVRACVRVCVGMCELEQLPAVLETNVFWSFGSATQLFTERTRKVFLGGHSLLDPCANVKNVNRDQIEDTRGLSLAEFASVRRVFVRKGIVHCSTSTSLREYE